MKHAYIVTVNDDDTDYQSTADELYQVLANNSQLNILSVEPFAAKKPGLRLPIPAVKPAIPSGPVQ